MIYQKWYCKNKQHVQVISKRDEELKMNKTEKPNDIKLSKKIEELLALLEKKQDHTQNNSGITIFWPVFYALMALSFSAIIFFIAFWVYQTFLPNLPIQTQFGFMLIESIGLGIICSSIVWSFCYMGRTPFRIINVLVGIVAFIYVGSFYFFDLPKFAKTEQKIQVQENIFRLDAYTNILADIKQYQDCVSASNTYSAPLFQKKHRDYPWEVCNLYTFNLASDLQFTQEVFKFDQPTQKEIHSLSIKLDKDKNAISLVVKGGELDRILAVMREQVATA
jgi:hypothetical protein